MKSVAKRSVTGNGTEVVDMDRNSTQSENLSLFQALRVLQEDEEVDALKSELGATDNVCLKSGAFTAMIGTVNLHYTSHQPSVKCSEVLTNSDFFRFQDWGR